MDVVTDIRFPHTAKKLLSDLQSGKITLTEFLLECAYWALLDGFDELQPKPFPPKPDKVLEYEVMSLEKRSRLKSLFFDDNPEINRYCAQRNKTKAANRAILNWLKEIKKYLPVEDTANIEKIDARILELETFLNATSEEIESAKHIFSASTTDG